MIPDICTKMQNLINDGITKECHVVYLLTCIRKILEQEGSLPDKLSKDLVDRILEEELKGKEYSPYNLLKFYCNWALHAALHGAMAQKILLHFNEAHTILSGQERELPKIIQEISKFTYLTNDIEAFLQNHSINTPPIDWSKFIYLYASIIEDCPLIISEKKLQTSQISKVTAKLELAKKIQSGQQYYKVSWIITDSDGNDGELEIINSFDV